MKMDDKIKFALESTEVLVHPRKFLATYESTTVRYFILTTPFYIEFEGKSSDSETVVREGRITWQKPKLITPYYILRMEGFSNEARQAFQMMANENTDIAMMLYRLKFIKEYDHMDIVSGSIGDVRKKIETDIEKKQDPFCAVIKGIDEYWDISLTKFIYELMLNSAYYSQIPDFNRRSLLYAGPGGLPVLSKDSNGIPVAAKNEIENLFILYRKGEIDAKRLKEEIDSWGLFDYYQDRFFNLFKRSN